jgi:hypothetical protein
MIQAQRVAGPPEVAAQRRAEQQRWGERQRARDAAERAAGAQTAA